MHKMNTAFSTEISIVVLDEARARPRATQTSSLFVLEYYGSPSHMRPRDFERQSEDDSKKGRQGYGRVFDLECDGMDIPSID
jgi:hypothetical protein